LSFETTAFKAAEIAAESGAALAAEKMLLDSDSPSKIAPSIVRTTEELERLLTDKPITFVPNALADRNGYVNSREGYIKTGHIEDDSGRLIRLFTKPHFPGRLDDFVFDRIHRASTFSCRFPVTVERPDMPGILVQERIGKSVRHRFEGVFGRFYSDQSVSFHGDRFEIAMKSHLSFSDQMEQAVVERVLLGVRDGHLANFAYTINRSILEIANIDVEKMCEYPSQGCNRFQSVPVYLQRRPISDSTQSRIRGFLEKFGSINGREFLAQLGMKSAQVEDMLEAGDSLLRAGQLPG
jgi:hypothetical protein